MTHFETPTTYHATEDTVFEEVNRSAQGGEPIGDEVALAIAGWYAGPMSTAMPFTKLAQTGCGDTAELGEAIKRELDEAYDSPAPSVLDQEALEALDRWVSLHEEP